MGTSTEAVIALPIAVSGSSSLEHLVVRLYNQLNVVNVC